MSYETIVSLISNTRTRKGLRVEARLDSGRYPTGIKVSDEQMACLRLDRSEFHGDWNYRLLPRSAGKEGVHSHDTEKNLR